MNAQTLIKIGNVVGIGLGFASTLVLALVNDAKMKEEVAKAVAKLK